MPRSIYLVLYLVAMVAIIVGVDLLLLRDHFWARLLANIGIVAAFLAIYFVFLRRS